MKNELFTNEDILQQKKISENRKKAVIQFALRLSISEISGDMKFERVPGVDLHGKSRKTRSKIN